MKFKINREEFTKSLLNVSRVIQPKGINPVLSNIKLSLDNTGLNLTGTNNDITISETIPLFKGDKEIIRDVKQGQILVNAKIITDVARKIDGDELFFEVIDDSIIKIANEKTTFKLNSINVSEYPDVDLSYTGTHLVLDKTDFINLVDEVCFAASQKDTRLLLTCVNFVGESNLLTITATDGARLSSKKIEAEINDRFNVNILSKTLYEVVKSVSKEEYIELYISDKKVLFVLDNVVIVSRLVPGEYPNTKNIIPKNFNYFLEVNSEELLNTIDRISLLSVERENVVKLTLTSEKCEVSSKSAQMGSANETLNLVKFDGDRLEISFNASFVASAIRALKSEDVLISFIGEMKPFTVTNKDDENIIQLITPLRTF